MKTAVIYARYSSNSQTEQFIEGQLTVCQKYALDNGLQVVETYIDRAVTGRNDNRVAFQRMLSDSDNNAKWDIVLVYALDRFGRNAEEVAANKRRLRKNGKLLISATQRTSVNIEEQLILTELYLKTSTTVLQNITQRSCQKRYIVDKKKTARKDFIAAVI